MNKPLDRRPGLAALARKIRARNPGMSEEQSIEQAKVRWTEFQKDKRHHQGSPK